MLVEAHSMSGDLEGGRARRGLGVGRRSERHPPGSPRQTSGRHALLSRSRPRRRAGRPRSRPRAAHRSGGPCRRRRPAGQPPRRRGTAGRSAAHHGGDELGHLATNPRRDGRRAGDQPPERRALRRGESDRPSGGDRPCRPARLVGPPRHRPAPRQRGPRARLRRALRRGARAARTGRRAGAGHERRWRHGSGSR